MRVKSKDLGQLRASEAGSDSSFAKRTSTAEPPPPVVPESTTSADRAGASPPRPRAARPRDARAARAAERGTLRLRTRDRVLFWAMAAFVHALSLLPDFVLYPIGVCGGWLAYWLDVRHVRIGEKNLAIAFPDRTPAERARILRASYVNLGRCAAEYIRLGGFFYRRFRRRVTYDRFDYWNEVAARNPGRGVLILTAHFGNFELLPAAHALKGFQISLVHHTQRFLAGDALMSFVRERAGVEIIRKHAAARAVLRALAGGKLVGIPFDQNAKRSEAIFVPFFGEPAATASGLARLARISGAPVVPVFIVREPDRRSHRIEIQSEIELQTSGDEAADLIENTRRFVAAVEAIVRRHPDQFLWTHRRFRTRPRGMPPVYDD